MENTNIENTNIHVLFIEDDEGDAYLIQSLFRDSDRDMASQSVRFTHVDQLEKAEEHLANTEFDVILLDLTMGVSQGEETFDRIYEMCQDTPIVVLTGLDDKEEALSLLQKGAQDYLVKGEVNRNLLERQLRYAIERFHLLQVIKQQENKTQERETYYRSLLDRLYESEALYASLVESLPQNIFRKNARGEFIFANQNFCQFIGLSKDEILGKTDADLYPSHVAHKFQRDDQKVLTTGQSLEVEEENITTRGEKYIVNVVKTPIFDHEGNITGIQGIFWDVTEKRKLQEQLLQSQKMEAVGKLAGGVAHDFNNLLMVINSYSDFLVNKRKGDAQLAKDVDEIKKAADRATVLTRQLLTFSRRQTMDSQVIHIREIFENMDKMLRRLIGEDIELITMIEEDIGRVKIDPGNMEQILMNLVVNSRDAMPDGGKLTIEIKNINMEDGYKTSVSDLKAGDYVMLAVSDTGAGMDQATQRQIFEPFFTTKGKGGTGLGLSTVYGIVQQNNGVIHVYSEYGQGTCFKIYFPRCDHEVKKEAVKAETQGMHGTEKILVVEDDEEVRKLMERGLGSCGYSVQLAKNGKEAIELCKKDDSFDLLISDVVMPEMSGRQMVEQVRRIRPNLPVLYMSGYTDDAIIRHGVLEKDTPFIQKPFTMNDLNKTIREILEKPKKEI